MFNSIAYSLLRLLLDLIDISRRDQAKLQAEVLVWASLGRSSSNLDSAQVGNAYSR
jgi:hypothetical protein